MTVPGEVVLVRPPGGRGGSADGESSKTDRWKVVVPAKSTPGPLSRGGLSAVVSADSITNQPDDENLPLADAEGSGRVRVKPIRSVIPVARLAGESAPSPGLSAADFVAAVVTTAAAGGHVPQLRGELGRLADGTLVSRFPSTVPTQIAALKLGVLPDRWGGVVEQPEPTRIVFRVMAGGGGGGLFGFSKKKKRAGLEVAIKLPTSVPGRTVGEVVVTGCVFGEPDGGFIQLAQDVIPKVIADVKKELGNVEDRRKHPRISAMLPLTVHPLHSDGTLEPAVVGMCRDVSLGGLAFTSEASLGTRYAYVIFDSFHALAGIAVMV
jgi:hypothetical protein